MHDGAHDGQPQTCPAARADPVPDPAERLEQPRQRRGGHDRPGVDDLQHRASGVLRQRRPDPTVRNVVGDSVLQQVVDQAFQQPGVTLEADRVDGELGGDLSGVGGRLDPADALPEQGIELDGPRVGQPGVGPGQREQRVHDPLLAGVDLQQRSTELDQLGRGVGIGQRDVDQGAVDRDRGLQLVRGVPDECLLVLERRRQPFHHRVEGAGELAQLVPRTGHRDPLVEVAGSDHPRGRGDLLDRSQQRPATNHPIRNPQAAEHAEAGGAAPDQRDQGPVAKLRPDLLGGGLRVALGPPAGAARPSCRAAPARRSTAPRFRSPARSAGSRSPGRG